MAMLSAGVPNWTLEPGAVAGRAIELVTEARPCLAEVYLRPGPHADDLWATVGVVGDGDRRGAVWSVASTLSGLWLDWLGPADVGLVVWVPGVSVRAPCYVMLDLAGGAVSRFQWFDAAEVTLRLPT